MKQKRTDLKTTIMEKVKNEEISMKPKWFFVAGSIFMVLGLVGLFIGVTFLLNLTIFLTRQHGPGGAWRLEQMLVSFPWWVPVLAVMGMGLGIWMLRRFDFSYRKNFMLIVIGLLLSISIAGFAMDYLGLNDIWRRRGPMRRFYQQFERESPVGPGYRMWGRGWVNYRGW